MTQENYKIFRIFLAMAVAMLCSVSVVAGNYILPIVVAATAMLIMVAAKKRVEGVIADERDYKNAGDAARWSLNLYTILAAISSMVLMALRQENLFFEPIAQVLAYSACGLMILQSFLFRYFQGKK